MKTIISLITVTIIALLSFGFVFPNQPAPVLGYTHLINSVYLIAATGLGAIGLMDFKSKREETL